MIGTLIFVLVYGTLGAGTGGVTAYCMRMNRDNEETAICVVASAIVWPAAWAVMAFYGFGVVVWKLCRVFGLHLGLRLNRSKIASATVQMMEDDMARTNSSTVMINWDYRPCHQCFGSGCPACGQAGVERVKMAR